MSYYNSNNSDWIAEVGQAAAQFLFKATAMIPVVVVAIGAAIIINNILSSPLGFVCKTVPVVGPAQPIKRRAVEPIRVIPVAPEEPTKTEAKPLLIEPMNPMNKL